MQTTTVQSTDHTAAYQVELEIFAGPLDLLLHLIETREVDITKVSLAAVTDQYLGYIAHLERISAENLAEFLLVAAKLLLIKSRALLPSPPDTDSEEEDDVGEELAQQLLEYKRVRDLALHLRTMEAEGMHAYVRVAAAPEVERKLAPAEVTLDDLLAAVEEALSLKPMAPVDDVVTPLVISIADRIEMIEATVKRLGSFTFQELLRQAASRAEIIVTFLALLQLIKTQRVSVRQNKAFGEILVSAPDDSGDEAPRAQPP